jgi:hypothetical protein
MEYEVAVASNSMTFIPSFMKTGELVQKLKGHTYKQERMLNLQAYFFPTRKVSELELIICEPR